MTTPHHGPAAGAPDGMGRRVHRYPDQAAEWAAFVADYARDVAARRPKLAIKLSEADRRGNVDYPWRDRARQMRVEGKTLNEIALAVGVSFVTVHYQVRDIPSTARIGRPKGSFNQRQNAAIAPAHEPRP